MQRSHEQQFHIILLAGVGITSHAGRLLTGTTTELDSIY